MDVRTAPHTSFLTALDTQTEGSPGWLACRLRALLQGVVDATRAAWGRPSVGVGASLLAYGRRLAHVAHAVREMREMRAVAGVG